MVLKKAKDSEAKFQSKPDLSAQTKSGNQPKAKSAVNNSSFICIDYPTDGEILNGIHYAIRIGTSGDGLAQISFDGSEWKDCRNDGGFWWFDWSYFTPGTYKINARLIDNSGKVLKKTSTRCKVG